MFEHFRIPPELIPIALVSALTSILRTLLIGSGDWKEAGVGWLSGVLLGLLAGWASVEIGWPEDGHVPVAIIFALLGENIARGALALTRRFRDDPEGTIRRWSTFWRSND